MKLKWTPSIIKANFIQEYFKEICCLEMFPSVPVRCHSESPKGINKPNSTKMTSVRSNILKNPVYRFHFPWVLPVKLVWADRGCVLVSTVTLDINISTQGELLFPSMHWGVCNGFVLCQCADECMWEGRGEGQLHRRGLLVASGELTWA